MKKVPYLLFLCFMIVFLNCGSSDSPFQNLEKAAITLSVRVYKPASLEKKDQTTWSVLRVIISAENMDTILYRHDITPADLIIEDILISDIPPGQDRMVSVRSENENGTIIHSADVQQVDLDEGEQRSLQFTLQPDKGSLYFSIRPETSVDTIICSFATADTLYIDTIRADSKVFHAIDNISHGATGEVKIVLIENGTPVDSVSSALQFDVMNAKQVHFVIEPDVSAVSLNISLIEPAATLLTANFREKTDYAREETGRLLISEIQYAVNEQEYIEIYNPGNDTTINELVILKDGAAARLSESIFIASEAFLVVGVSEQPWVDSVPATGASNLNLAGTGGNWLVLMGENDLVFDWIAVAAGNNDLHWPPATHGSIYLDKLSGIDAAYNNFGENWLLAHEQIPNSTDLLGNPGSSGF